MISRKMSVTARFRAIDRRQPEKMGPESAMMDGWSAALRNGGCRRTRTTSSPCADIVSFTLRLLLMSVRDGGSAGSMGE
jgi:hypothetical protein